MVAPKENLLSFGHQVNMERRTFETQRVETQKQKRLHLLQHCQEVQEGVIRAQEHNRQLLQQFEEAQGTLRKMLTLTAAMKTTRVKTVTDTVLQDRMEYEKHLLDVPQWRQQLQEITREKTNVNNPTFRAGSSPGQPSPAQPSYHGPFHSPHLQPSWMVLPRSPPRLPSDPLPLRAHQSLPWWNVPDQPWFWTSAAAGTTSGPEARLCVTEPTAETGQLSQTSSAPTSSKESAGSRNSPSGQDLDSQPVRLLCSADGSDSTTKSGQVSRRKRGKPKHTSEGEHSSPNFQAVSAVMSISSGSEASAESRSTTGTAGAGGGPLKVEKRVKKRNRKSEECEQTGREDSESQRESFERVGIRMEEGYLDGRSEGKNEEVKDDERLQEEGTEESDNEVESDENVQDTEKQEREEEDISKTNNTTDEEENADTEEEMEKQESEEEMEKQESEEEMEKQESEEEMEEQESEEEMEEQESEEEMEEQESEEEESKGVKDKDNRKLDSTNRTQSCEDTDAESEDLSEEDEGPDENNKTRDSSNDEEEDEKKGAKKKEETAPGEDESDSDDCIISIQKSKRLHVIPEEAREDEDEEAKPGNSEEDSDEFSDNVKSPKTQEKEMKHEQKPKGLCDRVEIFQVETEEGSSHGDQPSDSDEFDHFFD